jgi:hypothetical protein
MKRVYLALAVIGTVVPYYYFLQFFAAEQVGLSGFVSAWFTNAATSGVTADVVIASLAFWVFMFAQRRAGRGPNPLLFIALNLGIGLSCALPAYLYARAGDES